MQYEPEASVPPPLPEVTKEYVDDAAPVVQTIILWRIYDVLLLLLRQQNRLLADELVEIHQAGEFVGPNPSYVEKSDG